MSKGIFITYACLLLSVVFLRQFDISNKGINQDIENNIRQTLFSNQTDNKSIRILAGETEDPIRQKICSEADNVDGVSQSRKDKFQRSQDEYRGAFGPAFGDEILRQKTPDLSNQGQKFVILIILVLFILLMPILTMLYCCYTCCDRTCPLCCKRDPVQKPFTRYEMICTLLCILIYSALTFSASVAGYVYSNEINSSYKSVKCTIVASLDDLNQEQSFTLENGFTGTFLGLDGLKNQLNEINQQFEKYYVDIKDFADNQQPTFDSIQGTSDEIVSRFNAMKTISFDRTYTKLQNHGFSFELQRNEPSLFYGDKYPDVIESIKQAQDKVSKATVDAMKEGLVQTKSLAGEGVQSFQQPLSEAQSKISDGQKNISDAIKTVDDDTDMTDTIFKVVTIFLMVFYGILIFIAVAGSIFALIGYLKNFYKVRYFLNALWIFLGFLTFIGFIICTVLGVLTILFMELCETSERMISDREYLLSFDNLNKDVKDYLTTCKAELGGDGDILKKFNVDQQVKKIKDTQQSLQDSFDNFKITEFQDYEKSMIYFYKQHETMEKYGMIYNRGDDVNWKTTQTPANEVGTFPMALDFQTASLIFLQQTQKLMNGNGDKCPIIDSTHTDKFVFEENQCTAYSYDAQHTVQPGQFETELSDKFCVNYEKLQNDMSNKSKVDTRYNNCDQVWDSFYDKINKYVAYQTGRFTSEVFNFKDEKGLQQVQNVKRTEFIKQIQQKQSSEPGSNGFGNKLDLFVTHIKTKVLDGSTKISNIIIGDNGILSKVNCLFFGEYINQFQDQMCSSSALSIYDTFKIMLVVCFSNFTLVIFLYKMSKRFLGKEKEREFGSQQQPNKIVPDHELGKLDT